jgi:hypothetical protein
MPECELRPFTQTAAAVNPKEPGFAIYVQRVVYEVSIYPNRAQPSAHPGCTPARIFSTERLGEVETAQSPEYVARHIGTDPNFEWLGGALRDRLERTAG